MANSEAETITTNGKQQEHEQEEEEEEEINSTSTKNKPEYTNFKESSKSLYDAVSSLLLQIFFPDSNSSSPFFHRIKTSFRDNFPDIRDASTAAGLDVLNWARQGGSLRLLLVICVGTIALITLTGILLFLLFISAATVNAIVLSLFVSLAAVGGFLAIFFACIAAIYIGALSIVVFVISSATISAIISVIVVTGWIGFFWSLWLLVKKSASFAKNSVTVTSSAFTAYTSGRRAHQNLD